MNTVNNKICLYGFLTAVVLACGCDKKPGNAQADKKTVKIERNVVKAQSNTVKLKTSMGDIVIELDEQAAPVTARNFLGYVEDGFYDGKIFHRVIRDFMIQGGGFTAEMTQSKTRDPIINEAANGLKNDRGTIAMARTNDPNSATAQFFINHKNNDFLNYAGKNNPGYAVFGKTIEGMDVVDAIASVRTTTQAGMSDVPAEPVVILSAEVLSE